MLATFDVETDVRRQYNRRVLFCIRIRGAALLIGLWDLFIHSFALCTLIFMFRHGSKTMNEMVPNQDHYFHQLPSPLTVPLVEPPANGMMENKQYVPSNFLLSRILEKRNMTRLPTGFNARGFYSNSGFMTVKWISSLSQQDRFVVFFVIFSATILTLAHICGILTNKPSYIVPYFLIKVFNVIVSLLSMFGFYAYMPDITVWLRFQPDFPFKENLLQLDAQTLQLIVFAFLLFIILAKLYIAAIIWYCYGYITALNVARTMGTIHYYGENSRSITGEMYSPPKYEEAIKTNYQEQENYAPPPYTPLLQ